MTAKRQPAPRKGRRTAPRPPSGAAALKLVRRRENSLLSLFELSHELGVALDPYEIAQLTLFSLMGHFGTAAAALWLLAEESRADVVLLRSFGMGDERARALGPRIASCAVPRFEGPSGPARLGEWADAGSEESRVAVAAGLVLLAPVRAQGRLLGFLGLGPRLGREPYAALDLEYLAAAAGMVGVALQNTRLYNGMFEANRQLRDTNERLAELDRLKSEFLQGVNHELRTPIAVIVGYLDVLEQVTALDETGRRAVRIANEQAEKLGGMVQDLLDFSELREDSLRLEIEPRDLEPVLRAFSAVRRPGVVNGLREFTLELEPGMLKASCDHRRVIQVLDALVDNAVKFTLPGSHVRMRAVRRQGQDGEWAVVEVEDDGPGIPEEQLGTLFEPFRQGDGSTTRETGGLGLGLALARRLAESMGGRLEVKSGLGAGSTFGLWLKAA
jgi:signal transduction histidine kinase